MAEPKIIKRYANRKLYDTERSCYVTLDEIAEMIKLGEDVRVIDNKSKDDLTTVTLTQIIVEEEKKVSKIPLRLLRGIIQSSNEAIGDFYQKHVADPAKHLKEDVERNIDTLFRKDDEKDATESTTQNANESEVNSDAEEENSARQRGVREFVSSTQSAFESWQRRIDEQVKVALAKMPHLGTFGTDVDQMKARIASLEERIKTFEKDED